MLTHFEYLKTLSFTDLEKANVEWGAWRVPYNSKERFTRLAANVPLSPEEFEKEHDSLYITKKYHYNFRHQTEMSEENMQKTFVNLSTNAFFENKDKTVRHENLNFDSMNSKEKEEKVYKMKIELEKMSTLPDEDQSLFTSVTAKSPVNEQFKIWRKNLYIPLQDQLEEHAKRKMDENARNAEREEVKEMAFFAASAQGESQDKQVYDMEQ